MAKVQNCDIEVSSNPRRTITFNFGKNAFGIIGLRVECSPMFRETGVQSQVASYQILLKWFLIPPCRTEKDVSRINWSKPGKGVVPSPTPRCRSYWKENLLVALDYGRQIYLLIFGKSMNLHICSTMGEIEALPFSNSSGFTSNNPQNLICH